MYTAIPAPKVEAEIERALQQVVTIVQSSIPARALRHILLAGGYGRHEGGLVEENGQLRPHNNFDIVIVVGSRVQRKRWSHVLSQIQGRASDVCGLDVDLSLVSIGQIKRNRHQVFWFDTLKHHVHLYGAPLELATLAENLPQPSMDDGLSLVVNRATLLLLNQLLASKHEALGVEAERLIRKHWVKATIGLGDIYLLLSRKYTPSYRERLALFKQYPSIIPNHSVRARVCEAIQLRFQPVYNEEPISVLLERCEWVLAAYRDAFALYESYRRKAPFHRDDPGRGYRSVLSPTKQVLTSIRRRQRHSDVDRTVLHFLDLLFGSPDTRSVATYLFHWGAHTDTNFHAFLTRHKLQLDMTGALV